MQNWLPSLNSLRALEAVSRHLSYTAAADELGVTPAAVKQLVSKLEEAIGAALVRREGNALALTDLASAATPDLARGMQGFQSAVRSMRQPQASDQLMISCEASFASAWLVPNLPAFRRAHPGVRILVESSHRLVDLAAGEADVAIRYGAQTQDELSHRLIDDEIIAVCSPSLWPGVAHTAPLEKLYEWPLVYTDVSRLAWAVNTRRYFNWSTWVQHIGMTLDTTACDSAGSFEDYDLAIQTAVAGLGVVLASKPILAEQLERGLLVEPFQHSLRPGIGFDIVTTQDALRRDDVADFVTWVRAAFD